MLYHITPEGDIHVADAMKRLFFHSAAALQLNENENVSINASHVLQPSTKAKLMSEAYHRYALNYINALNYLETLRRHQDFCDFEKVIFHLLFELDCWIKTISYRKISFQILIFFLKCIEYKKWCNRDSRCKKLQLTDLLVSPVHHIMKIPLVVRDIQARTENENEKNVISKVLEMKEKSLRK